MNLRDRIDSLLARVESRHVNWAFGGVVTLVVMTALVGGLAAAIVYSLAGLVILGVVYLVAIAMITAHEALQKWAGRVRARAQDRIERREYQRSRQPR